KTTSQFGIEFDSLADVVSFGVAPAILVYFLGIGAVGQLGLAGGVYLCPVWGAPAVSVQCAGQEPFQRPFCRAAHPCGGRDDYVHGVSVLLSRRRGRAQ